MAHWYFDERVVAERMRDARREAERAQALGPNRQRGPGGWERVRKALGRGLVALGKRLQQGRPEALARSSQCPLR